MAAALRETTSVPFGRSPMTFHELAFRGETRPATHLRAIEPEPGDETEHRGKENQQPDHNRQVYLGGSLVNVHFRESGTFFINRHDSYGMDRRFRLWCRPWWRIFPAEVQLRTGYTSDLRGYLSRVAGGSRPT